MLTRMLASGSSQCASKPAEIITSCGRKLFSAGSQAPGWFANQDFAFPFGLMSANMNWFMVTWIEILGGLALVLGLFTRFWAFSLIIVTWVAILGVHWPDSYSSLAELWKGYAISDDGFGNYRIPLLFLVMLFPLVFHGAGKLSLDHLLAKRFK